MHPILLCFGTLLVIHSEINSIKIVFTFLKEKISKLVEEERRSLAKSAREVWSNSLSRLQTQRHSVTALGKGEGVGSATLPIPHRPSRGGK